jgi:hypothetical protein
LEEIVEGGFDQVCIRTEPFPGDSGRRSVFFRFHGLRDGGNSAIQNMKDTERLAERLPFEKAAERFKTLQDWVVRTTVYHSSMFPVVFSYCSALGMRLALMEAVSETAWQATACYGEDEWGRHGIFGEVNLAPGLDHREALTSGRLNGHIPISRWYGEDRARLYRVMRAYADPCTFYEVGQLDCGRLIFWDVSDDTTAAYRGGDLIFNSTEPQVQW